MSTPSHNQPAVESPAEKVSAKLLKVSDGFIESGDTMQERESRLIAVCGAWNMACGNPDTFQQQMDSWAKTHATLNPVMDAAEIASKTRFIAKLIERKRNLYPDEHRQILDARIVPTGDSFRVEVACASLPG